MGLRRGGLELRAGVALTRFDNPLDDRGGRMRLDRRGLIGRRIRGGEPLILAGTVIVVDQLTKAWAMHELAVSELSMRTRELGPRIARYDNPRASAHRDRGNSLFFVSIAYRRCRIGDSARPGLDRELRPR